MKDPVESIMWTLCVACRWLDVWAGSYWVAYQPQSSLSWPCITSSHNTVLLVSRGCQTWWRVSEQIRWLATCCRSYSHLTQHTRLSSTCFAGNESTRVSASL